MNNNITAGKCNETTMTTTATTTPHNSPYYEDEHIGIRRYDADRDELAPKQVFADGMMGVLPFVVQQVVRSPFFWTTNLALAWLTQKALAFFLKQRRQSHGRAADATTTAALDKSASASWSLATLPWLAPSAAWLAIAYWNLRRTSRRDFGKFIQKAIDDDLSQIPQVYFGGHGEFLVAVDKESNTVVGCVGAQDKTPPVVQPSEERKEAAETSKQEEKRDGFICGNDDAGNSQSDNAATRMGLYELRRMSVNPQYQRRAVARKLVTCLERVLLEKQQHRQGFDVYLTCSNAQRPAHQLYRRCGYHTARSYAPSTVPWWVSLTGFSVYRFERRVVPSKEEEKHVAAA